MEPERAARPRAECASGVELMSNPEWRVQLIISGIPELLPFFRKDRQLGGRFRFMYLGGKLSPKEHAAFLQDSIEGSRRSLFSE